MTDTEKCAKEIEELLVKYSCQIDLDDLYGLTIDKVNSEDGRCDYSVPYADLNRKPLYKP